MDNYALSYHPHPPSRGARHPPPPESTHANFVCAGPGVVRWAFIRPMRRVIMFLSTLVRWALVCSRLRNKVPLCGWVPRYRAPRKCNFSWVVVPGWFIARSLGEGWSVTSNTPVIPVLDTGIQVIKLICVSKYRIENMCRLRDKSIHLDSGVKPRNDKLIEQVTNPAVSYHPVPTTHATRRAGPGIAPPLQRRGT